MDQASNLRELAEQRQSRLLSSERADRHTLIVTSGKGGVGKSFLSLNLARALSLTGEPVLLVDSNLHNPNLHTLTNIDPQYPIRFWLEESLPLDDRAIISLDDGLDLVANLPPTEKAGWSLVEDTQMFMELLTPLAANYRHIVLDTQTGLNHWNLSLLQQADLGLLVSISDPTSVIDTYTLIKSALPYFSQPNFRLVINQVIEKKSGMEAFQNLNLALSHFLNYEVELLSLIPFDLEVKKAGIHQQPLWQYARSSGAMRAIQQLAESVRTILQENKTTKYMEVSL